jgi:hypothetical protein
MKLDIFFLSCLPIAAAVVATFALFKLDDLPWPAALLMSLLLLLPTGMLVFISIPRSTHA